MAVVENPVAGGRDAALFRATVAAAAKGGDQLMGRLIIALRQSLSTRESATRDLRARDLLIESRQLLDHSATALSTHYPGELAAAFTEAQVAQRAAPVAMAELHFDDLELMDEHQVSESVETARSQQLAMAAADGALADLNRLVCAALGLKTVQPERNPLRPDVYVKALQAVLARLQLPTLTRQDWTRHMCAALGAELRAIYGELASQLRTEGVVAAAYAVLPAPGGGRVQSARAPAPARPAAVQARPQTASSPKPVETGVDGGGPAAAPGLAASAPIRDESFLTLNRLRRLLSGELDHPPAADPDESFADRFFREFDNPPNANASANTGADANANAGTSADADSSPSVISDFHPTVPASFDALTEMGQVDQAMARLETRHVQAGDQGTLPVAPLQAARARMHQRARGLGQALSLEVVTMMIDNIAQDPRLLPPIIEVVQSLEPPLLQLALVDPRFFSDKLHPARCLLQAITHRSLAFDTVDAPGFAAFLHPLQQALKPLHGIQIESADPFEPVLNGLTDIWTQRAQHDRQQLESAMQALRQAEARNLVAETISAEIRARPDAGLVAHEVLEFLSGPWAQVVGQARILDPAAADPGGFVALIPVLVWSAQPGLTRKNLSELTRQVPKLVATLRHGLASMQYPEAKSEAFFATLMNLHGQALRPLSSTPGAPAAPAAVGQVASQRKAAGLHASLTDDADPWVAPLEAEASGFMEMPLDGDLPGAGAGPDPDVKPDAIPDVNPDARADANAEDSLPLGAWVQLRVDSHWIRTQLTWASPQGTLFLFTSASGSTQSMTRRSRNKLFAAGRMRAIADHPVLDVALDAVCQTALFNSLGGVSDSRLGETRFS